MNQQTLNQHTLINNKYKLRRNRISLALTLALGQSICQAQFRSSLDLSDLNGSNGFVISGEFFFDSSGISVSAAGDVNGDGVDDLIIGATDADPNGNSKAGNSYVVYGSSTDLPNPFYLSDLNGSNGFVIQGENTDDFSGVSVSSAGDINGDGMDDVILGADGADPNGIDSTGNSYVVYGNSTGLPSPLDLSSLNGSNGFVIQGENAFDYSGTSVSSAGDINGDGIDDLVIGARGANSNGNNYAGSTYVIYGNSTGLPNPFRLSDLNGSNGFVIQGENTNDYSGVSVSSVGDINGDGVDDLVIGAARADPNGNDSAGNSYVVYGNSTGLPNPFRLSDLNGSNGFVIQGENAFDYSGISVSSAGDVNGDGTDDLIIGARAADPDGNNGAGNSYVIYGNSTGLPSPFDLSNLNGSNGFVIQGENALDFSGISVSAAGDVSGDGLDDLIIGAYRADPNGSIAAGNSYVVYGNSTGLPHPFDLSNLNGNNGFVVHGENVDDRSGVSVSAAGDINGDGIDDVIIGADGAELDGSLLGAGNSYVIFGKIPVIFSNGFEN